MKGRAFSTLVNFYGSGLALKLSLFGSNSVKYFQAKTRNKSHKNPLLYLRVTEYRLIMIFLVTLTQRTSVARATVHLGFWYCLQINYGNRIHRTRYSRATQCQFTELRQHSNCITSVLAVRRNRQTS
jgi:hypothetical protein